MNASHAASRAPRVARLAACVAACSLAASFALAQSSGVGAYVGAGLGGGLGWPGRQWSDPGAFFPSTPLGPGIPGIPGTGGLREVDPGYADMDPSRASMYFVGAAADLRTPTGFDRIFVGADGRFYRMNGSLVAAFDRSSYVAGPDGVYPEVPAGTVYYTEGLPPEALGTGAGRAYPRVDGRVGGAVRNLVGAPAQEAAGAPAFGGIGYRSGSDVRAPRVVEEPAPDSPTLVTDDAYRSSRLGLLLRDASTAR